MDWQEAVYQEQVPISSQTCVHGGTLPNPGRSTISHPHHPTPSLHVRCSSGCPFVCGHSTTLTKAVLYKTIRRVSDIKDWYLLATEYLECPRCKKNVVG